MTRKNFQPKASPGKRVRTRGAHGERVVVTTTVAKSTSKFFEDNPIYVMGRALDDWVEKKAGKDEEEAAKRFSEHVAKLALGDCKCGRMVLPPNRAVVVTHCPGCQKDPKVCDCQPSLALRNKWLLEWQQARQMAGMQTNQADLEAKTVEFGLTG